jgi:hypothetical protein
MLRSAAINDRGSIFRSTVISTAMPDLMFELAFNVCGIGFGRLCFQSIMSGIGGEGGIRTHGTGDRTPDFESGPFDHSGTSP